MAASIHNERTVSKGHHIQSGIGFKGGCFRGVHTVLRLWKAIHCVISTGILMMFVLPGFVQSCSIRGAYVPVNVYLSAVAKNRTLQFRF
jgi:hypothetical protein